MPPKKWSREIVVSQILTRHRGGRKLNSGYVQVHCRPLYLSACAYCGSWRNAIEAAGLAYDQVKLPEWRNRSRRWSREKIIAAIRKAHREGQPLNSNHVQVNEQRLYGASIVYFGGWAQAIGAAGFDYQKLRKRKLRSWSREAVVQEITVRSIQGLTIRGGDIAQEDRGLYHAAKRHFGHEGWAKARILAGFEPRDSRTIWTKQSVREEIHMLHQSGAELSVGSVQNSPHAYIVSAATKAFGSWANAIKAAGFDYEKIRKVHPKGWWTRSRVLRTIKGLERKGVRLSSKKVQQSGGGLFAAAIRLFGSWSQAVEAAGISYRLHCRIWSTKAWLRRMRTDEYQSTLERAQTHSRKRRTK